MNSAEADSDGRTRMRMRMRMRMRTWRSNSLLLMLFVVLVQAHVAYSFHYKVLLPDPFSTSSFFVFEVSPRKRSTSTAICSHGSLSFVDGKNKNESRRLVPKPEATSKKKPSSSASSAGSSVVDNKDLEKIQIATQMLMNDATGSGIANYYNNNHNRDTGTGTGTLTYDKFRSLPLPPPNMNVFQPSQPSAGQLEDTDTAKVNLGHPKEKHQYGRPMGRQNKKSLPDYPYPQNIVPSLTVGKDGKIITSIEGSLQKKRDTYTFEERLAQLITFQQLHGHCQVRTTDNPLGKWVNEIRKEYSSLKNGKLKPRHAKWLTYRAHIQALNSVGFIWDTVQFKWDLNYQDLLRFKTENGHTNVPRSFGSLGLWVQKQREHYKKWQREQNEENTNAATTTTTTTEGGGDSLKKTTKQKPSPFTLYPQRLVLLNKIDFVWDVKKHQFQTKLAQLKKFYDKHGHIQVRARDSQLGEWYYTKRTEYKYLIDGKKSKMSQEQRVQLEALGFCKEMFETRNQWGREKYDWDELYNELVRYYNANGHVNVPRASQGAYSRLGEWVAHVRYSKKLMLEGKGNSNGNCNGNTRVKELTPEFESKLDDLGFVWDMQEWMWNQKLSELKDYKDEHDNLEVPLRHGELGEWVKMNREMYKKYAALRQEGGGGDDRAAVAATAAEETRDKFLTGEVIDEELWTERFTQLQEMGFNFDRWDEYLDHVQEKWMEHFRVLKAHFEPFRPTFPLDANEATKLKQPPLDPNVMTKLKQWSSYERTQYRRYLRGQDTSIIQQHRCILLERAGFVDDIMEEYENIQKEKNENYEIANKIALLNSLARERKKTEMIKKKKKKQEEAAQEEQQQQQQQQQQQAKRASTKKTKGTTTTTTKKNNKKKKKKEKKEEGLL